MGDSLSIVVHVIPIVPPKTNLKITGIRIQDGATGKYYEANGVNADSLVWSESPKCTAGANLYIAVYATSATAGQGRLQLSCTADPSTFYRVTTDVNANGQMAVEGNYTMPSSDVTINVQATDL